MVWGFLGWVGGWAGWFFWVWAVSNRAELFYDLRHLRPHTTPAPGIRRLMHNMSMSIPRICCIVAVLAALAVPGISGGRAVGQAVAAKPAEPPAVPLEQVLKQAQATVAPSSLRSLLRTLTEEPHVAGTPADLKTAEFVRDRLRAWGWSAELVPYDVLLNYPESAGIDPKPANPTLEIVKPKTRRLKVTEEALKRDKDSASADAWPAFHGYGVSGTAEGQVVYANYGRPEDFEAIARLGIDVRGKVVLVRYGKLFRGLKLREAQLRGARGLLIYSDPADDGYMKGDVYPNGPFRPGSAVQRGSVQFLSFGPGDPTTPGRPSTPGTPRLPIDPLHGFPLEPKARAEWEVRTGLKRDEYFATIPSLPISYEAAQPILEQLAGPNVPEGWQGGLPMAYHVGPGPVEVRFSIEMNYQIRKIWNVVASLKGREEPGRSIMIGNHRDAWTYGAVDPSSGTAATMEVCRVLGQAYRDGWRPRRTLTYASWDGEEYGLVGSTEYAEQFGGQLQKEVALMLNVDSAVSGTELDLEGVPSLRDMILASAATVADPRTGRNLKEQWLKSAKAAWAAEEPVVLDDALWREAAVGAGPRREDSVFSPKLGDLGSGSDYTAYLDHLGIPAADINFSGRYGVYHSIYDNFFWMEKFGDPEFIQHATAARLYTAIVLKAASEPVLPMTFTPYAEAIQGYVDDLRRMVIKRKRLAETKAEQAFEIPAPRLKDLAAAVLEFQAAAKRADDACAALAKAKPTAAKLEQVNAAITAVERAFLHEAGLPGRAWYKHVIYAPGLTTGYAAWPLPGLRQAVLKADEAMAAEQAAVLSERLRAAAKALDLVQQRAR